MAELSPSIPFPVPETSDLGRYLEETITIDWQTPAVSDRARSLLAQAATPADGVEAIFRFVRDEIRHSFDLEGPDAERLRRRVACRASEVLDVGHGLCHAKSHLLAALLRFAGHPTGFCYVRLVDDDRPGRFALHGFNAVYWQPSASWILLDARGNRGEIASECRFEAPFSVAYAPDPTGGESLLPWIFKRPGKRVVDTLERAPDFETLRRNLPDRID